MNATINNLATVTKLDITGDNDRGEILVDFGGTDLHRLIEEACKQVPGDDAVQLQKLSSKLFMGNHKLNVKGNLVLNKKTLQEWKTFKI